MSCVLGHAKAAFGPNICTALAFWQYWESPEASKVAEAIGKVITGGKPPFRWLVMAALEEQYRGWAMHQCFTQDVTLGMAEYEALDLLRHYEQKRIRDRIGDAWSLVTAHPEKTREVALHLKTQLEEYVP